MLRLLIASAFAWLAGLGTYAFALRVLWGESLRGGDAMAVLAWSAVALLLTVGFVCWPALSGLRWLLGGYRPVLAFIATGSLLGVVPTSWIIFSFGGRMRDLLSPEAVLFYIMFAAVGAVLGFAFSFRRGRDTNSRDKA
ncbi:MAG: hypothetical protein AAF750_07725 [Planctomycetota bacterium]